MKRLTYGKQMLLGLFLVTLGHILSWVTDWFFLRISVGLPMACCF